MLALEIFLGAVMSVVAVGAIDDFFCSSPPAHLSFGVNGHVSIAHNGGASDFFSLFARKD